jgi:hypothetical protein
VKLLRGAGEVVVPGHRLDVPELSQFHWINRNSR